MGRQFRSKLLIEFALTRLSVAESLPRVAGSHQGIANSLFGIEQTRSAPHKLLLGFANSYFGVRKSLLGSESSHIGNVNSDIGSRNTGMGFHRPRTSFRSSC